MFEKECCHPCHINVLNAWAINYPLCTVRPWSTTTMTESKLWVRESPEMRSTEIKENVIEDSTARGDKPGTMGWVLTLAGWNAAHPMMNVCKNVDILGHQ